MHHMDFAWLAIKIASREWCACDACLLGSNSIRVYDTDMNEEFPCAE